MNSPLNEIFESLTSLKEELTSQNKENLKQKNLEKVKQFLLERELLSEKDNRQVIVNKLGLPQEVADFAHKISDKYSIWIANQIKEHIENFGILSFNSYKTANQNRLENVITMFKDDNRPNIDIKNLNLNDAERLYHLYGYITDWRDNPNTPSINLKNMSWDEAENLSREWHESLSKGGGGRVSNILDEKDKIIHKFNNGFYWVLRESNTCEKSKESMGHCARASTSDMYLFRLIKNDEEFITADWHPTDRYIIQLRGKANTKPKEIYYPYILWLIGESGYIDKLDTSKAYGSQNNFHISDLNNEQLIYVFNKNQNVINFSYLLYSSGDADKIINELLNIGGKEFIMNLNDDNSNILFNYSSEPEKIIEFGSKNFVMKLSEDSIIHKINQFYSKANRQNDNDNDEDYYNKVEVKKNNLINKLLNIGGKDFIMDLKPQFVLDIFINHNSGKLTDNDINRLLNIGGKDFIMKLDYEQIIDNLINNSTKENRDDIIIKILSIGGKDFIENWGLDDFNINYNMLLMYSSPENRENVKNLIQKYTGGEPITPMNEIFKSLTSLQEELTEQRKQTIKETNLMKVQNFIKKRKNNQ
jgi:hypothetical protein